MAFVGFSVEAKDQELCATLVVYVRTNHVGLFRRRRVRVEAEDRELRAMLTLTTQLSSPDTIVA